MGQRANFAIVENRTYTLYYSHWCANTITRDLFWGPDHALRFIRAQRKVDESGWLDSVWAEGGAVCDLDNHVLLLFGGEDIQYDVPLRRVYLAMLHRAWSPWTIRWAYEGIADIADYVGYPRVKVLNKFEDDELRTSLAPPQQREWTDIVASFRLADGRLRFYPLAGCLEWFLLSGANLAKEFKPSSGLESLPLDEWLGDDFANGGFHIDTGAKTLDFWAADPLPGIPDLLSALWTGWKVNWHQDNFEAQLNASEGSLRLPNRTVEALQKNVKDILLRKARRSSVEAIQDISASLRREGQDVKINPWALREDSLEPTVEERRRIVAAAIGNDSAG